MGRGRDESGDTDHPPLVVALDIRPAHGPPSVSPLPFFLLTGVALIVGAFPLVFLLQTSALPLYVAIPFFAPAPFACVYGVVVWRHRRRWLAWFNKHDASDRTAGAEVETMRQYEHAMRSNWKPIRYRGSHHPHIDESTLHMTWLRGAFASAGLTPPRAIALFPTRALSHLPLQVDSHLIEPEEIDAVPGVFVLAQPLRLLWTVIFWIVVLCLGYLMLLTLGLRPDVLYALSAIGAVGWIGFAIMSRVRDRGWAREIVVAPSCIQIKRLGGFDRYTPENTIVVVRPRRWYKQGISVILSTDGRDGSPPGVVLSFFGLEDAGFQKLWRAWIHPARVDRIAGSDILAGGMSGR